MFATFQGQCCSFSKNSNCSRAACENKNKTKTWQNLLMRVKYHVACNCSFRLWQEAHGYNEPSLTSTFHEKRRPYCIRKVDKTRQNRVSSFKTTESATMTNIYVSPLASPSFECLSAVELPPKEFPKNGEDKQEVLPSRDENANELFERKTKEKMKGICYLSTY